MQENTSGSLTFLVNLMFRRLDKFDELIYGWEGGAEGGWGGEG